METKTAAELATWLEMREQVCMQRASFKSEEERELWFKDACYLSCIRQAVLRLAEVSDSGCANAPLRMCIALTMLRAWNSGTEGYSADVVCIVNKWIDGGMQNPIPWPENPSFAAWAADKGLAKVDGSVGFKFLATLIRPEGEK